MINISLSERGMAFLRSAALALVLVLPFHQLPASGQSATLTIVTNPPQGGTATGAGTYSAGTPVTTQIQAATGWYISAVSINAQLASGNTTQFTEQVMSAILGNRPFTTIVSDSETFLMNSNATLSLTFAVILPDSPPVISNILGRACEARGAIGGRLDPIFGG